MAVHDTEFNVGLGATDNASGTIKKLTDSSEAAISSIDSLMLKITGLNQASELLHKAFEFVKEIAEESVGAFIEQEHKLADLSIAMRVAGNYSKEAFEGFEQFTTHLEETTTATEEQILTMERQGQLYGQTIDLTKKMATASVALGIVMKNGPEAAFTDLNATLGGNIRGLARIFPELKNMSKEALAAGGAVDFVIKKLGGLSEETAKSAQGNFIQLGKAVHKASEEFGGFLVSLVRGGQGDGSDFMNELIDMVRSFGHELKEAQATALEFNAEVRAVISGLSEAIGKVDFKGLSVQLAEFAGIMATIGVTVFAFIGDMEALAAAFLAAKNAALLFGGSLLKIIGYLAIISAEVILYIAIVGTWLAAFVALGVIVDLTIRNFSRFGDVVSIVILTGIKWLDIFAMKMKALTGIGDDIADLQAEIKSLQADIDKRSKGFDFGFAGKASAEMKKFMGNFSKGIDDAVAKARGAKKELENIGTGPNGLATWTAENQKGLDELLKKSEEARKAAERLGMDEIEGLKIKHKQNIQSVQDWEDVAKAAGAYNGILKDEIDLARKNFDIAKNLEIGGVLYKKVQEQIKTAKSAVEAANLAGMDEVEQAQYKHDLAEEELRTTLKRALAEGVITDALREQVELASGLSQESVDRVAINHLGAAGKFVAENLVIPIGEGLIKLFPEITHHMVMEVAIILGKIVDAFTTMIEVGGKALIGLLSGEFMDKFDDGIDYLAKIPENFLKAFDKLDEIITKFVASLPAFVARITEALPKLVDKIVAAFPKMIDGLVAVLPKIAQAIGAQLPRIFQVVLDAIPKIVDALPAMIEPIIKAIPVMVAQLVDALPGIVSSIFSALPQIFADIFKALPSIFENFAEHIDQFVEAFVQGLISAMGEIVSSFVEEMLVNGGLERIVGALIRAMPRIALALVKGFIKGIAGLFKGFDIKIPSLADIGDKITEGANALKKVFSGDASKLFAVNDLTESAKGAMDSAKAFIDEIMNEAEEIGGSIWRAFLQALMDGLDWFGQLGTNIWNGFVRAATAAYSWLKSVGQIIWQGISDAAQGISSWGVFIWRGLYDAATAGFALFYGMGQTIWNGLRDYLAAGWNWFYDQGKTIWNGFIDFFKAGWNHFYDMGKQIWEGFKSVFSIPGLGGGGGGIGGFAGQVIDAGSSIFGHAGGIMHAQHYAMGGMASLPAVSFTPRGTDTVPVMMDPKEMIMNPRATQDNLGLLSSLNTGGTAGITVDKIEINVRSELDADSVRRNIVPAVFKEIKRVSQDGSFVISSNGVRR